MLWKKKSKIWKHVFHPLKITGAGGRKAKNAETIYQALKEQKELLEKQAGEFLKVSEEKNRILKIKVAEAGFTDWFECSRYMKEVPRLEAYENDLKIYDQSVHAEEEKLKGKRRRQQAKQSRI